MNKKHRGDLTSILRLLYSVFVLFDICHRPLKSSSRRRKDNVSGHSFGLKLRLVRGDEVVIGW